MPRVHPVNPLPRQIGRCGEVLVTGRELRLQSPHPVGARGLPGYGAPADNPSHRGIASRAAGVVYALMATEATEDGSVKQSRHRVPAVLAGARIDRLMAGHARQPVHPPGSPYAAPQNALKTLVLITEPTINGAIWEMQAHSQRGRDKAHGPARRRHRRRGRRLLAPRQSHRPAIYPHPPA